MVFGYIYIVFARCKGEDYVRLESASRIFFQKLVLKKIPVRGAISFGKLYSHLERNIFVGPALIDAYNYGEDQDWLGFLHTSSASAELDSIGLGFKQSPFYMPIPKSGVLRKLSPIGVYAYAYNNVGTSAGNPLIGAMREMREEADREYQAKYSRSIDFAEAHQLQRR